MSVRSLPCIFNSQLKHVDSNNEDLDSLTVHKFQVHLKIFRAGIAVHKLSQVTMLVFVFRQTIRRAPSKTSFTNKLVL